MARSGSRRRVATALGGSGLWLLSLPGCLTAALDEWARDHQERSPALVTTQVPCTIVEARGTLVGAERRLHATLRPEPGAGVPRHLLPRAGDREAFVALEPRANASAASPWSDAGWTGWELELFDGRHLHRTTMNARVTLHGHVSPDAVARVVAPPAVAGADFGDVFPYGGVAQCLEGLAAHPWLELIDPAAAGAGARDAEPRSHRATPPRPIAFVAADGSPVATADVDRMLFAASDDGPWRSLALVARIERADGSHRTVAIDVPVLLAATRMRLERDGERIAFAHAQAWIGSLLREPRTDGAGQPLALAPIDARTIYHWTDEVDRGSLFVDIAHATLRPIAVVADFVLAISPLAPLARLFRPERPELPDPDYPLRRR